MSENITHWISQRFSSLFKWIILSLVRSQVLWEEPGLLVEREAGRGRVIYWKMKAKFEGPCLPFCSLLHSQHMNGPGVIKDTTFNLTFLITLSGFSLSSYSTYLWKWSRGLVQRHCKISCRCDSRAFLLERSLAQFQISLISHPDVKAINANSLSSHSGV